MECKNCYKKKNISKFRKNRRTCIKCEYTTRKAYIQKYQKDNKERLKEYNNIYQKSKNWYYIPKPKIIKPIVGKNIIFSNRCSTPVKPLSEKDIDMNFNFDYLL